MPLFVYTELENRFEKMNETAPSFEFETIFQRGAKNSFKSVGT